ncbi:MAG: Calx-beta domain-containing protein, partial [Mycobacterium sp.]
MDSGSFGVRVGSAAFALGLGWTIASNAGVALADDSDSGSGAPDSSRAASSSPSKASTPPSSSGRSRPSSARGVLRPQVPAPVAVDAAQTPDGAVDAEVPSVGASLSAAQTSGAAAHTNDARPSRQRSGSPDRPSGGLAPAPAEAPTSLAGSESISDVASDSNDTAGSTGQAAAPSPAAAAVSASASSAATPQAASIAAQPTLFSGFLSLLGLGGSNGAGSPMEFVTAALQLIRREINRMFNNSAPTAAPALTSATEPGIVHGVIDGVDAEGDLLTYEIISGPANGTVMVDADGNFTYEADEEFAALGGTDSFVVKVVDAGFHLSFWKPTSAEVPVTVVVNPGGSSLRGAAAAAATTGGTTTTITWDWGKNPVINFDPAKDKLDFGWMGAASFDVTEKNGSTVISVVDNQHSYTLNGVSLSQLSMTNIVAKDAGTTTKWQTLLTAPAQPSISIGNAAKNEGNSGTSNMTFTVTLSKASTKPVTVQYATSNGTATAGQDYTAATGTITFAAGETSKTINVAVAGDTTVEADETFTVTLSNANGANISTASATGTITNDDASSGGTGGSGQNSGNAGDERWGEAFYAPYVDMAAWPPPDLVNIAQQQGVSLLTLAFIQSNASGQAAWGGYAGLTPGSSEDQAKAIDASIAAFKAAGGDVMISFGGENGTSLAQYYAQHGKSAQELATAYGAVIDAYGLNRIDFDIEGAAVADPASIALNAQALKILQTARPDLEVWYTLPVLPNGLTADGINVVEQALKAGVKLDGINVMAMNFGASVAPTTGPGAKTMGAYSIDSAQSTFNQMTTLFNKYGQNFGWNQVGVTPMIGVNYTQGEVFTVADAQALEDFARTKGIGMLSMWSVQRDVPGSIGQATPSASGVSDPAGSFGNVWKDYGTINPMNVGNSGGGGGSTPVEGGTTTAIGWAWGQNKVLNFNPAKDKLDFGWMQPAHFDVSDATGSTVITIKDSGGQTYTLSGVKLTDLQMGNIVALDGDTKTKWQNLIAGAQPTTPTISIGSASNAEGNSGTANMAFTVTLSKAATSPVTVNYATSNGTATAGQDYVANTGTITFAAGETSKTINVAINGDATVESDETFTVTLSNPSAGATIKIATATGTITNDDADSTNPGSPGTLYKVTTTGADIVGFDPAKDKLDLGDVSVHSFIVVDTPEGVGFRNP